MDNNFEKVKADLDEKNKERVDKLVVELTKAKKTYDELIEGLQKKHDEADTVLKQCYSLLAELRRKTGKE